MNCPLSQNYTKIIIFCIIITLISKYYLLLLLLLSIIIISSTIYYLYCYYYYYYFSGGGLLLSGVREVESVMQRVCKKGKIKNLFNLKSSGLKRLKKVDLAFKPGSVCGVFDESTI